MRYIITSIPTFGSDSDNKRSSEGKYIDIRQELVRVFLCINVTNKLFVFTEFLQLNISIR